MSKALIPVFIYLLYLPESSHDLFSVVSMELNIGLVFVDVVQETCAGKNREKPIGFPMVSPWFPHGFQ